MSCFLTSSVSVSSLRTQCSIVLGKSAQVNSRPGGSIWALRAERERCLKASKDHGFSRGNCSSVLWEMQCHLHPTWQMQKGLVIALDNCKGQSWSRAHPLLFPPYCPLPLFLSALFPPLLPPIASPLLSDCP